MCLCFIKEGRKAKRCGVVEGQRHHNVAEEHGRCDMEERQDYHNIAEEEDCRHLSLKLKR